MISSCLGLVLNQIGRAALITKQIYAKRLGILGPSNIIDVKVSVSVDGEKSYSETGAEKNLYSWKSTPPL